MAQLTPGDPAPAFTLPDANGTPVSLADHAGERVIVYFYPAALTPGCTIEAIDFTTAVPALQAAGYTVIGISPDAPPKLKTFTERENLGITLLSDPEHAAIEPYGAWGVRTMYGKQSVGLLRSTFVVTVDAEGQGRIDHAWYKVRAAGHVATVCATLGVPVD